MGIITPKINEQNLMRLLEYSFSNQVTFIGELIQNARRAEACNVWFDWEPDLQRLTVTDDGNGIIDMAAVINVAETCWDRPGAQEENPFGLGFLAAVFAAEFVYVDSCGKRMSLSAQDIKEQRAVFSETAVNVRPGTRVILIGIDETIEIEEVIKDSAMGCSLCVWINGEEVPRPHAMDDATFHSTKVGRIHFNVDVESSSGMTYIYFNEVPVGRCLEYGAIVHLNPSQFVARMPDRNQVYDHARMIADVKQNILALAKKQLLEIKATMPAEAFAEDYYEKTQFFQCLDVWNDHPFLPAKVLCTQEYPEMDPWYQQVYTPIGRDLFAQSQVKVALTPVPTETPVLVDNKGFAAQMYAYALQIMLIERNVLDRDHWVWHYTRSLDPENISWSAKAFQKRVRYTGKWVAMDVAFCREYTLTGPFGDITITDEALYVEPGLCLCPDGETGGEVVKQVSDFIGEYDEFFEDDQIAEIKMFSSFLTLNRADSHADILCAELEDFQHKPYPGFEGKSFFVHFDENRRPHVEIAG